MNITLALALSAALVAAPAPAFRPAAPVATAPIVGSWKMAWNDPAPNWPGAFVWDAEFLPDGTCTTLLAGGVGANVYRGRWKWDATKCELSVTEALQGGAPMTWSVVLDTTLAGKAITDQGRVVDVALRRSD